MDAKPLLIVVFGLPGTGKSTLALALAEHFGAIYFNSDVIREQLGKKGHYRAEDKNAVYRVMLEGIDEQLQKDRIVVADATFSKQELRYQVEQLASRHEAALKWIETCAPPETVAKRVAKKRRYSEADFGVYRKIAGEFDPNTGNYLAVRTDEMELAEQLKKVINYISH